MVLGPVSVCVCWGGQCAKCVVSKLSTHAETHGSCAGAHACTCTHTHTGYKLCLCRSGMNVSESQECARRFLSIFHIKSSLGTALKAALRTDATAVKTLTLRHANPVASFRIRAAQTRDIYPEYHHIFFLFHIGCQYIIYTVFILINKIII